MAIPDCSVAWTFLTPTQTGSVFTGVSFGLAKTRSQLCRILVLLRQLSFPHCEGVFGRLCGLFKCRINIWLTHWHNLREAVYFPRCWSSIFSGISLLVFQYSSYWWNNFGRVAGRSLEYITNEPPFPSQFEYGEGPEWGFRPIVPPASGVTFSAALGGNRPREQFTGKSWRIVD